MGNTQCFALWTTTVSPDEFVIIAGEDEVESLKLNERLFIESIRHCRVSEAGAFLVYRSDLANLKGIRLREPQPWSGDCQTCWETQPMARTTI